MVWGVLSGGFVTFTGTLLFTTLSDVYSRSAVLCPITYVSARIITKTMASWGNTQGTSWTSGSIPTENYGSGLEAWWVAPGLYTQSLAKWGFDTHCNKGFIASVRKPVSSPCLADQ